MLEISSCLLTSQDCTCPEISFNLFQGEATTTCPPPTSQAFLASHLALFFFLVSFFPLVDHIFFDLPAQSLLCEVVAPQSSSISLDSAAFSQQPMRMKF